MQTKGVIMHYLELYIYTIDDKIHHIPIFIVADISKSIHNNL